MNNTWRMFLTVCAFVSATGFMSCGDSTPTADNTDADAATTDAAHSDHTHAAPTEAAIGEWTGNISTEQMDKVLASYYKMKDGLVATDGAAAKQGGMELLAALEGIESDPILEKVKFNAEHIRDTEDTEHQRGHFEVLSDNLFKIVKVSKGSAPVYQQFCPMAFDNKGAHWLSNEAGIRNPYFGDMMLTCGKVTEEIK